MQTTPTTVPPGPAASAAGARRYAAPAKPHPDRRLSERAVPGTGVPVREATAELAGFGRFVPQHFGNAGFLIHQLLSAEPELDGSAPDRPQTIAAYQAHLARRIHYSGPVRPVDLLI